MTQRDYCAELLEKMKAEQALLKSDSPLDDLFKEFDKCETDRMDVIRECIESRADEVIKRDYARGSR